jgi:hypothetical protein
VHDEGFKALGYRDVARIDLWLDATVSCSGDS